MAFNYQFPKLSNVDSVTVMNTPVAANDVDLDKGTLTIDGDAGGLVIRACDLLAFDQTDFTAGTPHAVDVDLTGVTLAANQIYSLTVFAPNIKNFFGGGQETGAIYQTRTYNVSSGSSAPSASDLRDLFIDAIAADPGAYFAAASGGAGIVEITALSADAGALEITAPAGATVADATAFVAPVGTEAEVLAYGISPAVAEAAGYDRYIIKHRKFTRSNAVSGLQCVAPVISLVYLKQDDAGTGATVTKITSILNGSYTPVADYLGCPAL